MQIKLLRQKNAGRLVGADDMQTAESWLHNLCLAPQTVWAGGRPQYSYQPMFNRVTKTFPPGLVDLVREVLVADGHDVEVEDARGLPPSRVDMSLIAGKGLRDYQMELINAGLLHTVGILKAATGAGKSWVGAALVTVTPDAKWLVVVHRETIRAQLHADIQAWLPHEHVGSITKAGFDPSRVTTATFDSLRSQKHAAKVNAFMATMDGLICDEAHVASAATHTQLLAKCVNAYYRLGMSATPLDRSDGRSIVAVAYLGKVLASVSAAELVDRGVLAKPYTTFVPFDHGHTYGVKFQTSYNHGVASNAKRDDLIVQIASEAPKPCIVFFKDIKHGVRLRAKLEKLGHNVMFVDGQTGQETRSTVASRVKHGQVDIIVASVVFNEGVNIPELASAVNAAAGKSVIQFLQRIGRVMRKVDGKDYALVYDVLDTGDRFLDKHAHSRINTLRKEGHSVRMALTVEDAMSPW